MQKADWARYQGYIYQIAQTSGDWILIAFPGHHQTGWVNVSPALGMPLLIPALEWAHRSEVELMPGPTVPALPPIPFEGGLQVGSRVKWGTSLAEWAVIALDGETAKIRQVTGWAAAMVWDAPISELVVLSDRSVVDVARAA